MMPITVDPTMLDDPAAFGLICDVGPGMGTIQVTGELHGLDAAMITLRVKQFIGEEMVQESNHDEDMSSDMNPRQVNINVPKMNGNVDRVMLYGFNAQGGASLQKIKITVV